MEASGWFYTNTIPYAFYQAFKSLHVSIDPNAVRYSFLMVYGFFYGYVLWRILKAKSTMDHQTFFRLVSLIYLLFYLTITIPFGFHYLLWALPWLILGRWPLSDGLVVLYSFTGLFSYCKRMNYLILIACIVYAGAYIWQVKRRAGRIRVT